METCIEEVTVVVSLEVLVCMEEEFTTVVLEAQWVVMGWVWGGPYGNQDPNDPNNPFGAPPSPPGYWISFLRVMEGVVTFLGRIAILVDQNMQAFHMFIRALLQLFDRSGLLYGELARFVLRLLGIRTKPKKVQPSGSDLHNGPHNPHRGQNLIEGPKAAPSGACDGAWGYGAGN